MRAAPPPFERLQAANDNHLPPRLRFRRLAILTLVGLAALSLAAKLALS